MASIGLASSILAFFASDLSLESSGLPNLV